MVRAHNILLRKKHNKLILINNKSRKGEHTVKCSLFRWFKTYSAMLKGMTFAAKSENDLLERIYAEVPQHMVGMELIV